MKVKVEKNFAPVTITLETQEEVNAIYALVNFSPIHDLHRAYSKLHDLLTAKKLRGKGVNSIHKDIVKAFG